MHVSINFKMSGTLDTSQVRGYTVAVVCTTQHMPEGFQSHIQMVTGI